MYCATRKPYNFVTFFLSNYILSDQTARFARSGMRECELHARPWIGHSRGRAVDYVNIGNIVKGPVCEDPTSKTTTNLCWRSHRDNDKKERCLNADADASADCLCCLPALKWYGERKSVTQNNTQNTHTHTRNPDIFSVWILTRTQP